MKYQGYDLIRESNLENSINFDYSIGDGADKNIYPDNNPNLHGEQ